MLKKMALAVVAAAALTGTAMTPASAARDASGNCIAPTPNTTGTLPQIPRNFVFIPGPGWVDPNSPQGRRGIAEYQACQHQRDIETGRIPPDRVQPVASVRDSQGNCVAPTPNSTGTLPQIPRWFVFIPGPGWVDPNSPEARRYDAAFQACQHERDIETGRVPADRRGDRQEERRDERRDNGYGNNFGYRR